jgi:hypothetical protein
VGGGLAGWSGGTTATFNAKLRRNGFQRPRLNTGDGAYKEGVGGQTSVRVSGTIVYKGNNYPPVGITNEFVRLTVVAGFTFNGVCLVEKCDGEGDVEKAVEFQFEAESDGAFTLT